MKQILILIAFIFFAFVSQAQKINESAVPKPVLAKFKELYPSQQVNQWEKEKNKFEAVFKKGDSETSVLFSAEGKLLETEMIIKVSDLLPAISAYVKKSYPSSEIEMAYKLTLANGKVTYEIEISDATLIFDSKGNFLKKIEGSGSGDD